VAALTTDAATAEELQRYRWQAAPLLYGQWNAAALAHAAAEPGQFAQPATEGFYAGFEPDPRLPGRLRALSTPTLLIGGEYDIWPTPTALQVLASLFNDAELVVLSSVGRFPWVDDPATFTASVERFLANGRPTTA
jgi:pimeloyl-ACP methyl ester carboxylesterase